MIEALATVAVAIVGALGLIAAELIRARRHAQRAAEQMLPNGGSSLRDAVDRIAADVREIRVEQSRHGERLATVETRVGQRLQVYAERRHLPPPH